MSKLLKDTSTEELKKEIRRRAGIESIEMRLERINNFRNVCRDLDKVVELLLKKKTEIENGGTFEGHAPHLPEVTSSLDQIREYCADLF